MQTHPLAKLIRSITFFAVVTSIFGFMAYGQETRQAKRDKPALSLQIAAALAKSGPTVAFIATNNTEKELLLELPGVSGSPIVVVKPDGKSVTVAVAVLRNGPLPTIKPHQTLTWSEDLYAVFNRYSLSEPGLYRVYWEANTNEPNVVHKSNELLILREKGTPAIDPTTGYPIPQPR